MHLGNCPRGRMRPEGYKGLISKFTHHTNFQITQKDCSTKRDTLRKVYDAYNKLVKRSGLGNTTNGAFIADEETWKTVAKVLFIITLSATVQHHFLTFS